MNVKSTKFNHVFSGYSVWLEPSTSESKEIIQEMMHLANKCGGQQSGVHDFPLHCTLLYNITLDSVVDQSDEKRLEKVCRNLLIKCRDEMNSIWNDPSISSTIKESNQGINFQLEPKEFYFFPYPKEADHGRGFGCVIPMLLLRNHSHLQSLHDIVSKVFPPDERHSQSGGPFIPHMALCYAPEIYEDELCDYTKNVLEPMKRHLLKPMTAKYLSVWNTQGMIQDWMLVDRISL